MNREDTYPPRSFVLEVIIYIAFVAVYSYINWYVLDNWPVALYEQLKQLWLAYDLPEVRGQIVIVLGLLGLAVILFAMETISVDIITLLLLISLIVTGILTPQEAFAGFSNEIIIILASIFVISSALQQTGIMDFMGAYLLRIAGTSSNRVTLALMGIVGTISMFMNNTTATAIFIPPTLDIARRIQISPSKLLMPIAYASILGGTCTLIGTSTNVAVSGYIAQQGLQPIGLFELLPVGLIILGIGIFYIIFISKYLLPEHEEGLAEDYAIREYLSEVVVTPNSTLTGQHIAESDLSKLGFQILAVLRGRRKFQPTARTQIQEGDTLLVQGRVANLMKVKEITGAEIRPEIKWTDTGWQEGEENEEIKMAEVLITRESDLIGRTLKSANFFQKYGMRVLAVYRHGQSLRDKLGQIRLRLGDLLLVQGPLERLEALRRTQDFWILDELKPIVHRKKKGIYTLLFMAGAVVLGGLGLLPLSVAFLAAAVLTLLFRCISVEEAYQFVEWRLIILIGGMTAFGLAMEKTGAAELLANGVVHNLEQFGVMTILTGFFVLTLVLTQPMSNAAAALVVVPVALHAAQRLGVNERTFAIAIMLAASVSLITPLEPSCLLIYGPGKYKFMDFVKVGAGLTILLAGITLVLVPIFWPL